VCCARMHGKCMSFKLKPCRKPQIKIGGASLSFALSA
jgi:hypothetical protein